jgi:hypothetical protein
VNFNNVAIVGGIIVALLVIVSVGFLRSLGRLRRSLEPFRRDGEVVRVTTLERVYESVRIVELNLYSMFVVVDPLTPHIKEEVFYVNLTDRVQLVPRPKRPDQPDPFVGMAVIWMDPAYEPKWTALIASYGEDFGTDGLTIHSMEWHPAGWMVSLERNGEPLKRRNGEVITWNWYWLRPALVGELVS